MTSRNPNLGNQIGLRRKGDIGFSAYDLAKRLGYGGTLEQWLLSLKGEPGNQGIKGEQGYSAYQIAVQQGFVGTESQWLNSLLGESLTTEFRAYGGYIQYKQEGGTWINIIATSELKGDQGDPYYVYIAYAEDDGGSSFTTTFDPGLNYIGIRASSTPLVPEVHDFDGLWFNYKGAQGVQGDQGPRGLQGIQGIQGNTGSNWTNWDGGTPSTVSNVVESFDFGGV